MYERMIVMRGSVRKKGNSWYYRIDLGKVKDERNQIERYGGRTKKEAETAMRKVLRQLDETGNFFEPSEISYMDFLQDWLLEIKKNIKDNTYISYESAIRNHIGPELGKYKIKSLSPILLQNFIDERKENGYSKSTLNTYIAILKKSLNAAVQPYQYRLDNPAKFITMPSFNQAEDIKTANLAFTNEEISKIFNYFTPDTDLFFPIALSYYTGMRVGECLALKAEHINNEDRIIEIRWTLVDKKPKDEMLPQTIKGTPYRKLVIPKNKKSIRDVHYDEKLANIIKKHFLKTKENKLRYGQFYCDDNKESFVCIQSSGKPLTSNDIRFFNKWCKNNGMDDKSFHSLRHTHATILLESGVPIEYVSKHLGHASIVTTVNTYMHVTKKMREDAIVKSKNNFYVG